MIQLSASFLSIFKECARCAWLEKNKKVKRPRGHFPSLPSGMDSAFKAYYDHLRGNLNALPTGMEYPELCGFLLFPDVAKLKGWRQWNAKAALKVENPNWKLVGGFDEVLHNPATDIYIPADFKTASSLERTQEDAVEYHETQLDLYDFMMIRNGMKTAGFGVVYLWAPLFIMAGKQVQFDVKPFFIPTNPKRALELCERAAKVIESPIMPPPGEDCEYCQHATAVHLEMPKQAEAVA